jgi:penicillin amidase
MSRARRWGQRILIGLGLLLVAAAGFAALFAYSSVPPVSGTLPVAGLTKPVDIIRDSNAVPHVFGSSVTDLYRGLGFAHAQDRLWQMETIRLAAQGRLSEVLGQRTIKIDVLMRTLDLYGYAERAFEKFPRHERALLMAYAEGVNAFIERSTGLLEQRLPLEFTLLRHKPEPWRPADSVAVVKMMALNLSTNLAFEIRRLALAAQGLSPAEIEDVMTPREESRAPPLPDLRQLYPLRPLQAAAPSPTTMTAALDEMIGTGASNSWVVSGERTKSGHPLLANDPHLGLSAPSTWYLAHIALVRPDNSTANAMGATLPGTPLIVLGRGDTLAWGFTNSGADVQDLFVEKLNPDNPNEYLTPDGWRAFESQPMEFKIAGGKTKTVKRLRSRHGPVLPASFRNIGSILQPGYVMALQWTALNDEDGSITAGTFDEKIVTVSDYFSRLHPYVVPIQAVVAADTQGKIGLFAPGRIPIRHPENTMQGRAPVPGWEAVYDWQGYVPFDQLPQEINPSQGAIGTANAKFVRDTYPYLITHDWDPDFRMKRVKNLIVDRSGQDMETMRAAQLDVLSPAFAELMPLMVSTARPAAGAEYATLLDQLARWDTTMRRDAVEPLIMMAWLKHAGRAVFADDLGPAFVMFNRPRAVAMTRILRGKATSRDWCDNGATAQKETCGDSLVGALKSALAELEKLYGKDRSKWSWGQAHIAFGENQVLGRIPVIGPYFNITPQSPGGPYTLNRGVVDFDQDHPFANRHAASYRAIYDLQDLDRSVYIQSTGQSGNPFSRYYRTFANDWANGNYITIPSRRQAIEQDAIGTWRLSPRPSTP